MKYKNWLQNKNLSRNTIRIYLKNYTIWNDYLVNKKVNKSTFVKFINNYSKNHKPRSTKLMYISIISIFKFEKRWKLINECSDIRLPISQSNYRPTITINDFNSIKNSIKNKSWIDKRNWLIFSLLLFTGIRASELLSFDKRNIFDNNKLLIKGKGQKYRVIYLNKYLLDLLNKWKLNKVAIKSNYKKLCYKEIYLIVKKIAINYFSKNITPHDLRRSYATNLSKQNVDMNIIKKILGHNDINTTSSYIQYNDNDIYEQLNKVNI